MDCTNIRKKHKQLHDSVVCDTVNDECFPVYCKTFDELHSNYHKYHLVNDQRVEEVIRIENDGTVDRNLEIHNLL